MSVGITRLLVTLNNWQGILTLLLLLLMNKPGLDAFHVYVEFVHYCWWYCYWCCCCDTFHRPRKGWRSRLKKIPALFIFVLFICPRRRSGAVFVATDRLKILQQFFLRRRLSLRIFHDETNVALDFWSYPFSYCTCVLWAVVIYIRSTSFFFGELGNPDKEAIHARMSVYGTYGFWCRNIHAELWSIYEY